MERFLWFSAVFYLIVGVILSFYLTAKGSVRRRGIFGAGIVAAFCLLAIYTLLGYLGVPAFGALRTVYLTFSGTLLVVGASSYGLRCRFTEGIARDGGTAHMLAFGIRLLAVLLLVETLICNSSSYARIWKGADTVWLSPDTATVTGATRVPTEDGSVRYEKDENITRLVLIWEDVQTPMGTLGFFFDTDAEMVTYSVDFSDETHAAYRNGLIRGTVYPSYERTRYLVTETSGRIGKLRVTFMVPEGTEQFVLTDGAVAMNVQVPFGFSPVRVSLVYLLIFAFYVLIRGRALRDPVSLRPRLTGGSLAVTLGLLGIFSIFLCALRSSGWYEDWHMTTGNQMTRELVDAFRAGQLHLLEEPSDSLLALENPYDWSQRSAAGGRILWDHLLYNGHYYSYYGIAPVVLLFLPYHLLTGYYFPSCWAVCLFGIVGIVFLGLVWDRFVKKFLPSLPLGMYIGGLWILEAISGVFYCYGVTNFYEIARSAGFCFVTVGAYFLLSSNVVGEGRISLGHLALSATAFSLAVLSRPTEAVWCVVAVLFLGFGLWKHLRVARQGGSEHRMRGVVCYLAAAFLPYLLIGGAQMLYNKLRFGSVFDFGIQYSLTINDFTKAEFGFRTAMIGFWNYLFAPPSFTDSFPFLTSSYTQLGLNGYYFNATPNNAVGLVFRALPVLTLFAAPRLLKLVEHRGQRIRIVILGSAVAVIAPAVIIFSIWESGYCVHYGMDFFWEMAICALGLLGLWYIKVKNRQVRGIAYAWLCVSVLLSVLVSFALYFRFFDANSSAIGFDLFGRLFAFWLS